MPYLPHAHEHSPASPLHSSRCTVFMLVPFFTNVNGVLTVTPLNEDGSDNASFRFGAQAKGSLSFTFPEGLYCPYGVRFGFSHAGDWVVMSSAQG